jgi:hypothetical protein
MAMAVMIRELPAEYCFAESGALQSVLIRELPAEYCFAESGGGGVIRVVAWYP